jgi:membrane associated rhomboid family serine protease
MTRGVKGLLIANVGAFLLQWIVRGLIGFFGLVPEAVFERFWIWQPVTYMFLHADVVHLLLNMLVLWMFGVTLERHWGRQAFLRYYFVCGIGAAITSLVAAWLPFDFAQVLYYTPTVGASGAIYGLLLAFGVLFPHQPIYMYFLFPVPARIFVLITGALVLWSSMTDVVGGTAHLAHLGGMLFGYAYLTMGRGGPLADLKYHYVRWRMNRMRKRFGVHDGGRGGWDHRVH